MAQSSKTWGIAKVLGGFRVYGFGVQGLGFRSLGFRRFRPQCRVLRYLL